MRALPIFAAAALVLGGSATGGAGPAENCGYLCEREPARLALVVANSSYDVLDPLPSAAVDAARIKERLEALRFDVTLVDSFPSVERLENHVLPAFRDKIREGDIVVFYFSGHGFSYGPNNFIAPANIPRKVQARELTNAAIPVESLEDFLGKPSPGLLLFLLDACRSIAGFVVPDSSPNAFVAKAMAEPSRRADALNVMYAFASKPGFPALTTSEAGKPSMFTGALSAHIAKPAVEFESLFKDVSAEVFFDSGESQRPGITNWSDAYVYLDPSPAVLAGESEQWLSALLSQDRRTVSIFLRRFTLSKHADAARQWLADHPEPNVAASSSRISPWAVERAWQTGSEEFLLAQAPNGFNFANVVSTDVHVDLSSQSDRSLGMVPWTSRYLFRPKPRFLPGLPEHSFDWDVAALAAHRNIVTTQPFVARYLPSSDAPAYSRIALGTPLSIQRVETNPSGKSWLAVSPSIEGRSEPLSDSHTFYIELPTPTSLAAPVKLGTPIEQIEVRSAGAPLRELLEREPIASAVERFRVQGKTLSWVSLATGPAPADSDQHREDLVRSLWLSHAAYLLRNAGVDARNITSTANVPGIPDDAVRIRFFGN